MHPISIRWHRMLPAAAAAAAFLLLWPVGVEAQDPPFQVVETTIGSIHAAFKSGKLTSHQLTQMYLDRIAAYDKAGPKINSIISINPNALKEADRLDAAFKATGMVGPLHGVPVVLKDQIDVAGIPTTLGSVVFKDYIPTKDAYVVEKMKAAGAIILGKATLAEFAAGDTFGSLFGETRNPYDVTRTVGGSSGGPAAALAANLSAIAVGQEGLASIRRPATWNSIVGMRPTAGLVSRAGAYGGWPSTVGSLGPMARTVEDLAILLDVLTGYDPEDPVTALGVGQAPRSFTTSLVKDGLKGARIGILRESFGLDSEPDSADFKTVTGIFNKAVMELKASGAEVVDPIEIPKLKELMSKRGIGPSTTSGPNAMEVYLSRNPNSPFKDMDDVRKSPDFAKVFPGRFQSDSGPRVKASRPAEEMDAREELMLAVMKVMADYKLDAIVHKSVEHTPTLIADGIKPPYPSKKGSITWNTFLIYVASVTVPAGFTPEGLPVGITFFGRGYSEPQMLKYAYAYEQATHHRKPPATTPPLK